MSLDRPESPSSPASWLSAPRRRRGPGPPWRWTQSTRPGSRIPGRVAITSPSSGVKPIVVSTDRPPSTAASDAPGSEVRGDQPQLAKRSFEELRCTPCRVARARARGSRSGAAASAPTSRRASRTSRPRAGAWRERRCRSRRHSGTPGRSRSGRVDRRERRRIVQRRQLGEPLRDAARPIGSSSDRSGVNSVPPWTTRCPIASARHSAEEGGERHRRGHPAAARSSPASSSITRRRGAAA